MNEQEHELDPWMLTEHGFDRDRLGRAESLFALANGHLGLRGNLDEGEPRGLSGTYLNGVYESYPLQYGERGFGFAEDGQAIVNVPDGKIIRLLVENEPVDVERGTLEHHTRSLDMRAGILRREMTWRSDYDHRVKVTSERLVSFVQRSVAAIAFEVEALDQPLRVALQSLLVANESIAEELNDPRAARGLVDVFEPQFKWSKDVRTVLAHTTQTSRLNVAAGMDHVIEVDGPYRVATDVDDDIGRVTISVRLQPGQKLRVIKMIAYHWSSRQTVYWLRDQVDASLENALGEGWGGLVEGQRRFLDDWWRRAEIEIDGDQRVQQSLRFALFHLLQASARIEGRPIAAKGLTGPGYDGHAFWDTETFVLPILTYLEPRSARDVLEWRASTLHLARERAVQFGLDGAMLPWRTIHGEECSGYWPAGLAAVHVNADIADAVRRYVQATGDEEFEKGGGLELLVETARLWNSLGAFDHVGRFRLPGVTGPDEYSAIVDDNVYTNLMAQTNLRAAARAAERHPAEAEALGVHAEDIAAWRNAASAMHVPYNEELGLHPQDATFLDHQQWDWESTTDDEYPLMLNHPYFTLYRRQVIKQADLVLALWLRGDAFTDEEKLRNFNYYESITVRDSSLSAGPQSIVAAEVGHMDLAWAYLREAAFTDIDDLHRNTHNGLHMASLAGVLLATVSGLGGVRDAGHVLTMRPRLPRQVQRLRFRLQIRNSDLRVTILPGEATYCVDGDPLELVHWGQKVTVDDDETILPIPPAPDLEPPKQPPGREPGAESAAAMPEDPTGNQEQFDPTGADGPADHP